MSKRLLNNSFLAKQFVFLAMAIGSMVFIGCSKEKIQFVTNSSKERLLCNSRSPKNYSINKKSAMNFIALFCGDGRNRTADTRIFSPLLYRLSYITALKCGGKDINLNAIKRIILHFFEDFYVLRQIVSTFAG